MTIRSIILAVFAFSSIVGCALPATYEDQQSAYRKNSLAMQHNFVAIEEGKIYSSANPSREFTRWLAVDKRVKTFVSLRGNFTEDQKQEIRRVGGQMYVYHWSAKLVPPESEIAEVLQLLGSGNAESPVHFFCKAGADRTGFIRAYWRIDRQGWSKEHAFREMKKHWHVFSDHYEDYLQHRFPNR